MLTDTVNVAELIPIPITATPMPRLLKKPEFSEAKFCATARTSGRKRASPCFEISANRSPSG